MSAWPSLICATVIGRIATVSVGIDHIGIGSLRALLHDRCGNGQAVMPCLEEQPRVDEFARPKLVRLVGKVGLELDRAGGLQDLVVDEPECALIELDRIVLAIGENRKRRSVCCCCCWICGRSVSGSVKISEIGSICVTTTRPFASVGWMTLPMSICRMPVTPSIGEVSRV